jgi:hypothetical protein
MSVTKKELEETNEELSQIVQRLNEENQRLMDEKVTRVTSEIETTLKQEKSGLESLTESVMEAAGEAESAVKGLRAAATGIGMALFLTAATMIPIASALTLKMQKWGVDMWWVVGGGAAILALTWTVWLAPASLD